MIKTILYDKKQKHIHKILVKDYTSPYCQKSNGSHINSSILDVDGRLLANNMCTSRKNRVRYTYSLRMAMLNSSDVVLLDESDALPNYPPDHLVNRMVKLENVK